MTSSGSWAPARTPTPPPRPVCASSRRPILRAIPRATRRASSRFVHASGRLDRALRDLKSAPGGADAQGVGMMSSIRTEPAATLRRLAHLQRLLEPGAIRPVYQPIVRVSDLEAIGYEGLARFPYADGLSDMPPDVTLAAAGEIGLRGDVEVACWAAMATAGSPPAGRLLFANISPPALAHPALFLLASRLPSRLVIE